MNFGTRPVHQWVWKLTLIRWIDADTFEAVWDHGARIHSTSHFRLLGINAPEIFKGTDSQRAAGFAARMRALELVPVGSVVIARTEKPDPNDKYGRWLAVVWPAPGTMPNDERSVNEILVDEGQAELKTY